MYRTRNEEFYPTRTSPKFLRDKDKRADCVSWSVMISCFWVLAAAGTALLPMRRQYAPGITLLIMAPVLIIWLGYDFGWGWSVAAFVAFASMFRNPLRYIFARLRGQNPPVPK